MAPDDDTLETEVSTDNEFCTLQVRTKRGDGTRDSDRITATLGRDTLAEVEEDREEFIQMVRETVEEVRRIQPGDDGDGEDGGE